MDNHTRRLALASEDLVNMGFGAITAADIERIETVCAVVHTALCCAQYAVSEWASTVRMDEQFSPATLDASRVKLTEAQAALDALSS